MLPFGRFKKVVLSILIVSGVVRDGRAGTGGSIVRKRVKDQRELMDTLLDGYNTVVRPIRRPTDSILVSFDLALIEIADVDEEFGCITTSVWQRISWNDWRLRWDPREYGNISDVKIPIHRIWAPDILPYNNGRPSYAPTFQTNAVVKSNGTVAYIAPYTMVTPCEIDAGTTEQTCSFNFGSWTLGRSQVKLNLVMPSEDGADSSKYTPKKDWELCGITAIRTEKKNDWLTEPYVDITYNLILKRNTDTSDALRKK